jgi:hypothetical protein
MAQTYIREPRQASERQHLRLEKLGVIAGFLFGLPLAISAVGDSLGAWGAPTWMQVAAGVITVAATTRLGLLAATALARKLSQP